MEIRDKQRKDFSKLVNTDIPSLLKSKSFVLDDRYDVKFSMYPVDVANPIDDPENGSVYVTIKAICDISDLETGEQQKFFVDLLNLPVYQELGFKVGNNYKQVLGLYERPAGWSFLKEKGWTQENPKVQAVMHTEGFNRWMFTTASNAKKFPVFVPRSKTDKEDSTDFVKVSISTFFRALTGMSNQELLEMFGYDNPVNLLAFNDSGMAVIEAAGGKNSVENRNDCIITLAKAIFSANRIDKLGSLATIEHKLNSTIFNSSFFGLGEGNKDRLDFKQSFKNRATNKILAEDIILHDEVIKAGSILSADILEKVDNSPVDEIKVSFNGQIHTLKKFSHFTFRALGYYVVDDLEVAGYTFKKGHKLTLDDLHVLNSSQLSVLQVSNINPLDKVNISATELVEMSRRLDASTIDINDLFTAYSIFANNLNGFDTFDKEYELTNRVIVPFAKNVINILNRHMDSITSKLSKGLLLIKQTEDSEIIPLLSLSDTLKLNYSVDELIDQIKSADNTEGQMSDINNSMSFVSKSYKITADINDRAVTDSLIKIQDTQIGRLDLYDAPESKKIGRVHHKTLLMKEDEYGNALTPFLRVHDGEVSDEVVYLSAAEEENVYVAEWNEIFKDEEGKPKQRVLARYNGEIVTVDTGAVTYKEYSFLQNVGPTTSCIPFINHSNGKRLTMSCNQQRQATPTLHNRRANVGTGTESLLNVGRYTATDIIDEYYTSAVQVCPELEQYKDSIYSSTLQLDSISNADNGDRIYSFTISKIEEIKDQFVSIAIMSQAKVTVPFNYRTTDSGIYSYKINVRKKQYSGDDIVLYSADYDAGEYDMDVVADFGAMKVDNKIFKSGLALGIDIVAGYKTCEGSTIDDSLCISNRLVYDDELTSILMINVEATLYSDDTKTETFKSGPDCPSYFDASGLPKVGTYLNPGDPVIMKVVQTIDKKDHVLKTTYNPTCLNVHQVGQVFSAKIYTKGRDTKASVIIALRADACVGDKLAGRYGNKGVIAKIIPMEQMPYDPKTGLTLDLILDPEGIPSRMNISQLIEGNLGLSLRKEGKKAVVSQFNENGNDYVRELANSTETHPMMLVDGRTGQYFERPINVVSLYMYKLVHMARKKIHSIGMQASLNSVSLQPKHGSKFEGGQSFGEMESWCLEGIGANKILQELQSVSSDDIDACKEATLKMSNFYQDIHVDGENHNDLTFQALVRSLGAEVVTKTDDAGIDYFEYKPLTDTEIRSLSSTPIRHEQALHSATIFGSLHSNAAKLESKSLWGYIDLDTKMISPLWLEKSSLYTLFLVQKKKSYTLCTKNLFTNLIKKKVYVQLTPDNGAILVATADELKEMEPATAVNYTSGFDGLFYVLENYDVKKAYEHLKDVADKFEKSKIIGKYEKKDEGASLTATDYMLQLQHIKLEEDVITESPESVVSATDYREDRYLKYVTVLRFMKDFIDRGASLRDYIITAYPVMSQVFRPDIKMPGLNQTPDFDHYYQAILNAVKAINNDDNNRNRLTLYNALADFMGFGDKKSEYVNLSNWFLGKDKDNDHGIFRSTMQSKVIRRSGRAVIVPSADTSMDALHIGIPISMAVVEWEEPLTAYLNSKRKVAVNTRISAKKWRSVLFALANRSLRMFKKAYTSELEKSFELHYSKAYVKFMQYVHEFIEGCECNDEGEWLPAQIVMCGRQPSLHQFSIKGYYVRLVYDRAIHINPLVCKGYNADFDGDQMWNYAFITKEAKEEAIQKMSAASNLVNPKNSSIILELSQDMALGIYCATMLKHNSLELTEEEKSKAPLLYSSIEALQSDVYNRVIKTYDTVCLCHKGRLFLSTAGRIVFNSLLPYGLSGDEPFTNPLGLHVDKPDRFCDLQYDGLITAGDSSSNGIVSKSLQSICNNVYQELLQKDSLNIDTIEVLQRLADFGFRFADVFGISIALEDLDEIASTTNRQEHLKEIDVIKQQIEEDYQLGLFSDEDKKDAIYTIFNETMDTVKSDLFSSMNRDNNIFIMFDSGARGSKAQITQTCGAIGILDKAEGESLETPITSNYHEGMSSFDVQMMSYSTRMGMSSTQNKTADSGYATRQSIYMAAGLKIVEWDCGKTDWWFDIMWDQLIPEYTFLKPSLKFFKNNLLGRKVWSSSKETINLFGDTLDNLVITDNSYMKIERGFKSIVVEGSTLEADLSNVKAYYGYKIASIEGYADAGEYVDDAVLAHADDLKRLEVIRPEEIKIDLDSVVGCKLAECASAKEFKYFTENGRLTNKCKKIITNKHVLRLKTDAGEFNFRYHMTAACRSLLQNREAMNLKYLEWYTYGHNGYDAPHIITEKTLDYIEAEGIATIEARILLDCLSGRDESKHTGAVHGCCARCYGLKYSNRKYPEVGEIVGIEAAQAIGEPASQLTLSLVNKGGAAGESVASGVEIFKRLLNGSTPNPKDCATLVAKTSGYLKVDNLDDASIIRVVPEDENSTMCSKCKKLLAAKGESTECPYKAGSAAGECLLNTKVFTGRLLFEDGVYVDAGEAITEGYVLPDDIVAVNPNSMERLVRHKQMVWLLNYFNTFQSNNIYINARHFEIYARLQNLMMLVVKSSNPDFKVGQKYEYSELVGHEDEVVAILNVAKQEEVIIQNSGALSALSFENVKNILAELVVSGHKNYRNAPIGEINVGQNLLNTEKKVLRSPHRFKQQLQQSTNLNLEEDRINFYVETVASDNIELALNSLDLDAILNTAESDTTESSVQVHIPEQNVIRMELFDNVSKTPVADVAISLLNEASLDAYHAVSDYFGAVELRNVSPGEYSIELDSSDDYVLCNAEQKVKYDGGIVDFGEILVIKQADNSSTLNNMDLFSASGDISEPEKTGDITYKDVEKDSEMVRDPSEDLDEDYNPFGDELSVQTVIESTGTEDNSKQPKFTPIDTMSIF